MRRPKKGLGQGRGSRRGLGQKDESQKGWKAGGMKRNEISICRHPSLKKKRK